MFKTITDYTEIDVAGGGPHLPGSKLQMDEE